MKCKEIHQKINSYLDKKLEEESLELFSSHLKECSSCKRLVNEVSATWTSIDQVEKLQSDPFLYTRIMQEVENRTLTGIPLTIQRILQPMLAAAVLVVGIYIGVGLGNNYSMDSEVFASAESQTLMDDYLFNDIEYESVEIFLLNE